MLKVAYSMFRTLTIFIVSICVDATVTEFCQPSGQVRLFAMVTYLANSSVAAELHITADDFETDWNNR